jgi:hypothetical protein
MASDQRRVDRLGRGPRPGGGRPVGGADDLLDLGYGPAEALAEALETRGGVGLLDHLGERWYRLAARAPEAGGSSRQHEGVAERFVNARRALNLLADRHLFGRAPSWFPTP